MSASLLRIPPTSTPFATSQATVDQTALAQGTPLPTAILGGGTITPTPPRSVSGAQSPTPPADEPDFEEEAANEDNARATTLALVPVIDLTAINRTATALASGAATSTPNPNASPTNSRQINLTSQPDDEATESGANLSTPVAANEGTPTEGVDVFAFCDDEGYGISAPVVPAGSSIEIYWAWFARTRQQVQDHIDAANHTIRVGEEVVPNPDTYVTPIRQQGAFYVAYYYVPYGPLEPGTYEIQYQVTWETAVNDGDAQYGPGTNIPFQQETCTFTVR
jgi:hypothetical protein